MKHLSLRHDIQFLRGFAILAVLVYHSDVVPLAGGYLGVDVFFVISGFLITTIVLRDLAAGHFSFARFYARRAKRLLPAAYSTLIVSTLLCAKILGPEQWQDFIKQLVGTVTFTANMVLPFQSGYFETAADGKPLLHTWSLSVEEQYYLCIPLLLCLIPSRWHFATLATLILLSMAICVVFVSFPFSYWRLPDIDSTTAAFYFLPTRAWEMLTGSLLAWLMLKHPDFCPNRWVKGSALALIGYLYTAPIGSVHPRESAILAVSATTVLLAGNSRWLIQNRLTRAVEKLGDWSYSLYLVHWPLFALARTAYLEEAPKSVKVGLVLAAIALAYLQYQYVEQRFRFGWQANRTKTFKWLAAASVMVVVLPISADWLRSQTVLPTAAPAEQTANWGFSQGCSTGKLIFENPRACSSSDQPEYALWGDSYAMHLLPGLKLETAVANSLIQITKSACAPILGVASLDRNYDATWAQGCLAFNEQALRFIENHPSIRYVLMSSPFSGYFDEGELTLFYNGSKMLGDRQIAIAQMLSTLDRLIAHGKTPILIAPPPRPGFNIGECWQHKQLNLLVLGRDDCNFLHDEHQASQSGVIKALNEIQARSRVKLFRLDDIICRDGYCITQLADGASIYRDGGHLSIAGARWLVPQLGLAEGFKSLPSR